MKLLAILIALSTAASAAMRTPESVRLGRRTISRRLREAIIDINKTLGTIEAGRRLLALTSELPIDERSRQPGDPIRFVADGSGLIVVDSDRAPDLTDAQFEAGFVKARWEATTRISLPLTDLELAGRQQVMLYFLEKADQNEAFAETFAEATRRARELVEERRKTRDWAVKRGDTDPEVFPGRPPKDELERVAFEIYLLTEDPYLFYWSALNIAPLDEDAVSLSELEDFIILHSDRLDIVEYRVDGVWAVVEGKVYPGRVARAALKIRDREQLKRLREGVGPYRTVGRAELSKRGKAWLRKVP